MRRGIEKYADLKVVHVGAPKSGSNMTYSTFRSTQHPTWREVLVGDQNTALAEGSVDGYFSVGATPNLKVLQLVEQGVAFDILPVRRTDLSLGLDIYRSVVLPDTLYGLGSRIETISVPTVLLASRTLPRRVVEVILDAVDDPEGRIGRFPGSAVYLDQMEGLQGTTSLGAALSANGNEDLPLPPHPSLVRRTLGRFPLLGYCVALIIVAAMWIVWSLMKQWSGGFAARYERFASTRAHFRDGHFLIATCTWFVLVVLGLKYFETEALITGRQLVGTQFVFMTFFETLGWLLVFVITGFTDSLYPMAPIAKYLPISAKIIGSIFFAYVGVRILTYLIGKFIARRGNMQFSNLSQHIVVCNWNKRGTRLIEHLRSPDVPAKRRNRKIVIVTRMEIPEAHREIHDCLVVEMDAWERTSLLRARAEYADSIIVLAPDDQDDLSVADGVVLQTALAVKNFLPDAAADEDVTLPSLVAEINLHENRAYLEELGVEEIVVSRDIGMRLVAQTVICPGVTSFFNEILDASPDSNEVYTIALPNELDGVPADFLSVLEYYRSTAGTELPVLPIGMKIPVRKDYGPLRNGNHVHMVVLVNPQHDDFDKYGIESFNKGDQILALADNPPP